MQARRMKVALYIALFSSFLLPNAYVTPQPTKFMAATPIAAPLTKPLAPNLFVNLPAMPSPEVFLLRANKI